MVTLYALQEPSNTAKIVQEVRDVTSSQESR